MSSTDQEQVIRSKNLGDLPPDIGVARSSRSLFKGWQKNNLSFEHRVCGTKAVFLCRRCKHYAVKNQQGVKNGRIRDCGSCTKGHERLRSLPPMSQSGIKAMRVC